MAPSQSATSTFPLRFGGSQPSVLVKAPGRVNLIGEHIDYNGFGVLPCAIERYTTIAAGLCPESTSVFLSIRHVDEASFSGRDISQLPETTPMKSHHWSNYVLAAYMGIRERLGAESVSVSSIQLVVDGNLPRAAGVSSSSSLVVASALAVLAVLGLEGKLTKLELAEICASCERFVGTAGGGMDQAAIVLSNAGSATHITFTPTLGAKAAVLPGGMTLVVANSMVTSEKAETAPFRYNKRVFECRLGAYIMHKHLGLADDLIADICHYSLADLMNLAGVQDLDEMLAMCEKALPKEPLSRGDVSRLVPAALIDRLLDARCGRSVWDLNSEFHISSRVRHVYTEASRVLAFAGGEKSLQELGELMNQSHESCRVDYDCSCPELDELSGKFLEAGALGARLTGAGWGGCVVAMVPSGEAPRVMAEITASYYGLHELSTEGAMFSFEPASGASFEKLG